jgi:hypothetical protein
MATSRLVTGTLWRSLSYKLVFSGNLVFDGQAHFAAGIIVAPAFPGMDVLFDGRQ